MDSTTLAQFLHELATGPPNCHYRIVAFLSQARKQNYIARQATPAGVAEYTGYDRIHALQGSFSAAATMPGRQFHIGDEGGRGLWHAYGVVYCNMEVFIIDPE